MSKERRGTTPELNAPAGPSPELLEVLAANQMNSQQVVSRAMR